MTAYCELSCGKRRGSSLLFPLCPLPRLAAAATSYGLITAQLLVSLAFVGSCELPSWLCIMWRVFRVCIDVRRKSLIELRTQLESLYDIGRTTALGSSERQPVLEQLEPVLASIHATNDELEVDSIPFEDP